MSLAAGLYRASRAGEFGPGNGEPPGRRLPAENIARPGSGTKTAACTRLPAFRPDTSRRNERYQQWFIRSTGGELVTIRVRLCLAVNETCELRLPHSPATWMITNVRFVVGY